MKRVNVIIPLEEMDVQKVIAIDECCEQYKSLEIVINEQWTNQERFCHMFRIIGNGLPDEYECLPYANSKEITIEEFKNLINKLEKAKKIG